MVVSLAANLAQASPGFSPLLILALCVLAGVGTVMMLPGRKETAWAKVGGVAVLAAGLIFLAVLVREAAGEASDGVGLYFWIFSAIAIASALRVITHPRPVYSALYFVMTVMASAGLFVLLAAPFMAAALVVIYAGAILVTYVFVIMLAQQTQTPDRAAAVLADYDHVSREPLLASALGFVLMGLLLFVIFDKGTAPASAPVPAIDGSTQALGKYLFENQTVNLELAGLILTISMVGAIVIARRRVVGADDQVEPSEFETISAPAAPLRDDPRSIPVFGTDNPRQKEYPER